MAEIQNLVEATGKELKIKNNEKDKAEVGAILKGVETKVTNGENMQKKYDDYLATFNGKAALGQFAAIANRDLMDAKTGKGSELMRKLGLTPKVQDELRNRRDASQDAVANIQRENIPTIRPVETSTNTASSKLDGRAHDIPFHVSNVLK